MPPEKYTIQKIIKHWRQPPFQTLEYLVKWEGYEYETWEQELSLRSDSLDLLNNYRREHNLEPLPQPDKDESIDSSDGNHISTDVILKEVEKYRKQSDTYKSDIKLEIFKGD